MSVDGWHTILVLGGIRSGKSEFAESLVGSGAKVRYVATAAEPDSGDPEWAARIEAHRRRRPEGWTTEETTADPSRLAELIAGALPDETLLLDDLGGWITVLLDPAHQPADDVATIRELAGAVGACAARLILVSPEVGLSMVPMTPLGRAFADALGSANRAIAETCDAVVLVVAGQPAWLKPTQANAAATAPAAGPGSTRPGPPPEATRPASVQPGSAPVQPGSAPVQPGSASVQPGPASVQPGPASVLPGAAGTDGSAVSDGEEPPPPTSMPDVLAPTVAPPAATAPPAPGTTWAAPTMSLPITATGLVIQPGMELPMPDDRTAPLALERLGKLDIPGAGLGNLERVITFAAGTQATAAPRPWQSVRVLLLHGDHRGGAAAGTVPGESTRRADQARGGDGPLARLAAEVGATLQVVDAPTAAPMEDGPVLSAEAVDEALRYGWRLAEEAAESGVQVIVLAACGAGTGAASAAVLAATAGAEPAAVLGRVIEPGGQIDDASWMVRCATVRDAMHRIRGESRGAREILAELGGGDIAIATGVLLGATARRVPVLLDGPIGVAAGLVSRDLAGQARHWCLLADHGGHPAVRLGADVLGLTPLFDLRLDLGEGTTALATLPLLRSALTLAAVLPAHPTLVPPAELESDGWTTAPDDEPADNDGPDDADGPDDDSPDDADGPADDGPADKDGPADADDREFIEPEPAGPGPAAVRPGA